ncbi:MAG: GAF domain-containing sensor histidine kinase [Anaerolineae bacterium]
MRPVGAARAWRKATNNRDERLLTIIEIAKTLATSLDQEGMLDGIIRVLIETLGTPDAGVLLLLDAESGHLTVRAAQGFDSEALRRIKLLPGESMSGKTLVSGEPLFLATPDEVSAAMADMSAENRAHFAAATAGLHQPLSALCVPLKAGEACIGVLVLENMRQTGSFGPDDLQFLQHVADIIALAIENVRLREELQSAQTLSQANRLKAELISTLAHEMRTPLTSIKGYSSALLLEEATFSSETQREFLQIIDEECSLLQDLIHDLLESSVIDAGLLELQMQPILLRRLVE